MKIVVLSSRLLNFTIVVNLSEKSAEFLGRERKWYGVLMKTRIFGGRVDKIGSGKRNKKQIDV